MNQDRIKFEILPDGRIKSETSAVSAANHSSAEELFRELTRLTGGTETRTARGEVGMLHHHHHGEHSHTH